MPTFVPSLRAVDRQRGDDRRRRACGSSAPASRAPLGSQRRRRARCSHDCRLPHDVFTDYLWFNTKKRQEFVRITDEVAAIVKKSGVKEGMVLVSAMHITAGVYVNDWEDGLIHDFQVWLEKLAPAGLDYRHHQTGEDNADAHLKRTIMGHRSMLPITDGEARSRSVGAGVLRRVRRPAEEARGRQGDGRCEDRDWWHVI